MVYIGDVFLLPVQFCMLHIAGLIITIKHQTFPGQLLHGPK